VGVCSTPKVSQVRRSHRFRWGLCVLALAAVVSGWAVAAQTLPQGVRRGATLAGITEYTYPNGLRVLLLPDSGSNTITVNVTYLVGSRHEGYGETGMAHLLEHMNFIRSTHDRNIKKELQDHGARWNGTTYYDRTNYFETVNASEENLRWALGLEAERMVNMRIEKPLLDPEMTVVRNEFERGENNPGAVLEERVLSTAYLWHNYGKSTIGSRADIERVPIDRLAAFYRKYYQPDNAVVTIAGEIDPARTLSMVAEGMGAIPRPARTLDQTYTAEPPQDGERSVELRRVGRGKNLVIAYHAPAMAHPDSAALEVMAGVLSSGRGGTGRLDKALVETKKALSVTVGVQELHDPGFVLVTATLSDDQSLDEVKKIIVDTIAELERAVPTQEETGRARTRILQGMDRAMANSQQLALQLSEVIASGDWRLLFTNYEEIKRVTPSEVARVAKAYLKDSNRTVGMFIPDQAPQRVVIADAPGIETLLKSYTPSIDVEEGEALDPSPAGLEKRIQRSMIGDGFRVVLVPKRTRGGRVQASLTLRFGDQRSLAGRDAAARLTDALLLRGTKTKSRQQIQDELQRLNSTISFGGGGRGAAPASPGSVTASLTTTAENLEPALRLAVEILREPAFPDADFDQLRKQLIAQVERGRTEPGVLVSQTLQGHLSPYPRSDARHVSTIDEEVEDLNKVTLDDVKLLHQQFFGASHGELIVVGKFDAAPLKNLAAQLLGSWKSASPYERIVSTYSDVERINTKIETPDKENAQFSAGLRLRLRDSDPDYPALLLANYMFGGGLSSRLPDRVRNREGLSYSVGSGFTAPVEGDAAAFSASAIANPANVPKVEASFMDELTRTLRAGFTASELAAAKKAIQDSRVGARSSDAGLLSLIAAREQYGRDLLWDQQLEAKLAALTVEQVNAAFRRHINAEGISIVKGGDFERAKSYR
jgi:zinc protease